MQKFRSLAKIVAKSIVVTTVGIVVGDIISWYWGRDFVSLAILIDRIIYISIGATVCSVFTR